MKRKFNLVGATEKQNFDHNKFLKDIGAKPTDINEVLSAGLENVFLVPAANDYGVIKKGDILLFSATAKPTKESYICAADKRVYSMSDYEPQRHGEIKGVIKRIVRLINL